jgi:hypothetical protein
MKTGRFLASKDGSSIEKIESKRRDQDPIDEEIL